MKSILSISILLTCASAFANAAPAASVQLLPVAGLMPEGQVGPASDDDVRIAGKLMPKISLMPEGQVGPAGGDVRIAVILAPQTSLMPEGQVGPASDDD